MVLAEGLKIDDGSGVMGAGRWIISDGFVARVSGSAFPGILQQDRLLGLLLLRHH